VLLKLILGLLLLVLLSASSCLQKKGDVVTITTTNSISSIYPSNGSLGVPIGTLITVTFQNAVTPTKMTTSTTSDCAGTFQLSKDQFTTCIPMLSEPVAFSQNKSFKITPASPLEYSTTYQVKVSYSYGIDNSGLTYSKTETFSFTSSGIEKNPPYVASTSPADGSTDVSLNETISVTFNEIMTPLTITTNVSDSVCTGSFQVSADDFLTCLQMTTSPIASTDLKTYSVTPLAGLDYNLTYKIKLDTTITDAAGNALTADYVSPLGFWSLLQHGFIISSPSANVNEKGGTAVFTLRLKTEPSADVTLPITSGNALEASVLPASLTFSITDPALAWNLDQVVYITGVDDALTDGDQTVDIQFGAAVSADPNYSGLTSAPLSLLNIDDESAGFIVTPAGTTTTEAGGTASFTVELKKQPSANVTLTLDSDDLSEGTVSPQTLIFTNANWNNQQNVTVTGVDDFFFDGDIAYNIVFSDSVSPDIIYDAIAVPPVVMTNTDDDSVGFNVTPIDGNTSEAGTTASFSISLTSEPSADVTLDITSDNLAEGTALPASMTFTSLDWSTPQTVTVTGVDDFAIDGDILYSIVLSAAVSADPVYDTIKPADVAVTNVDDDTAGAIISNISGNTDEAGTSATFDVQLSSQPTDPVTIPLSSGNPLEATVLPASLIFTNLDWNIPQTVTATGVDDFVQDGDQNYFVVLGVLSSLDLNFSGIDPADVGLVNLDNDTAGFMVSPANGNTSEAGTSVLFVVRLQSEPTADVTIPLYSSDNTEGIPDVSSLTFTSLNWNVNQTVNVTGQSDLIEDGNQYYSVILAPAVSADPVYSGKNPNDVSILNINVDVTGPVVQSSSPADGEKDVIKENLEIAVTYDETVVPSTVTANNVNSTCSGTIQVSLDNFSTCVPFTGQPAASNLNKTYSLSLSQKLVGLTNYKIRVLNTAQDVHGNIATASYTSTTGFGTAFKKLPDTAQVFSYSSVFGEDHDYLINAPSFSDNANNSVTDNQTGLLWQKDAGSVTRSWLDAVSYCDSLSLAGRTDWRLPTDKELFSITRFYAAATKIDTTYFPNAIASNYWSSTESFLDSSSAWYVNFNNGMVATNQKLSSYYSRCVSDGLSGSRYNQNLFTDNLNGTITDNRLGLVWQEVENNPVTWSNAIIYCEGLTLGGFSDWRLPNVKELHSLVDNQTANPSINQSAFPLATAYYYWSSTTNPGNTAQAYLISFDTGDVTETNKSYSFNARCVRAGI